MNPLRHDAIENIPKDAGFNQSVKGAIAVQSLLGQRQMPLQAVQPFLLFFGNHMVIQGALNRLFIPGHDARSYRIALHIAG